MVHPPSFVFVHGAWHNHNTWDRVVARLQPLGHACTALDLAGAGVHAQRPRSNFQRPLDARAFAAEPSPNAGVTQAQRNEAVIAAVRELGDRTGQPVVLAGHSLGGATVSHVARIRAGADPRGGLRPRLHAAAGHETRGDDQGSVDGRGLGARPVRGRPAPHQGDASGLRHRRARLPRAHPAGLLRRSGRCDVRRGDLALPLRRAGAGGAAVLPGDPRAVRPPATALPPHHRRPCDHPGRPAEDDPPGGRGHGQRDHVAHHRGQPLAVRLASRRGGGDPACGGARGWRNSSGRKRPPGAAAAGADVAVPFAAATKRAAAYRARPWSWQGHGASASAGAGPRRQSRIPRSPL